MDKLFYILKAIFAIFLSSVFACLLYIVRGLLLGMPVQIFKNDMKKDIIAYAVAGAVLSIIIMLFYYIKGRLALF